MLLRPSATDRTLDLPSVFSLQTLREAGDAFEHACRTGAEAGAGTIVWVRRFDVAEFAVVLEPEAPLAEARRAFYAGMNALADTLISLAPPELPVAFDWPDGIRVDGVLVGGGRLGWPEIAEDEVPDWLVFSAMVRTAMMRAGDPGLRPLLGSLDEVGFEPVDAGAFVELFARHMLASFHDWEDQGFDVVSRRWLARLPQQRGAWRRLDETGDLLTQAGDAGDTTRRSLRDALAAPSWRDPATGMPWL